jgi:hypothetical protein
MFKKTYTTEIHKSIPVGSTPKRRTPESVPEEFKKAWFLGGPKDNKTRRGPLGEENRTQERERPRGQVRKLLENIPKSTTKIKIFI